jgi:hypothetical protein
MEQNKFEELKNLMITAEDLSEVWVFFLDHFAESKEFIDKGVFTRKKLLEKLILYMIKKLFHIKTKKIDVKLLKIAKYNFYHGSALCKGIFCSIMYFESDDIGMLAFPSITGGNTEMIRFRVNELGNILN